MEVCDCGHPPTPREAGSVGTGYATNPHNGETMCYACADARELAYVAQCRIGDKLCAYLDHATGKQVTTWTGGPLLRVISEGARHPFSRERYYIRAIDAQRRVWSGVGAPGMWASLKLTKQVA